MSLGIGMASRVFGDFIKSAKDHGFARIVPLISIDSLVASSIVSKVLAENDVVAVLSFKPVALDEAPALLIDIPAEAIECSSSCLGIVYGGVRDIDVKNRTIRTPYSVAATVTKIVEDYWIIGSHEKVLSLLGGVWRGRDISKDGFMGLERDIAEELAKSSKLFHEVVGFRLWGWKRRSLFEILYRTISPFMPGLTGDRNGVIEFLKGLGFNEPESTPSSELVSNEDALKGFATELIKAASRGSRRQRSPLEFISRIYFVALGGGLIDLLELYGSLLTALSLGGELLINMAFLAHNPGLLDQLLILYDSIIDKLCEDIARAVGSIEISPKGYVVVEPKIAVRPEVFEVVLREIGVISGDDVCVAVRRNGRSYTSLSCIVRKARRIDPSSITEDQLVEVDTR